MRSKMLPMFQKNKSRDAMSTKNRTEGNNGGSTKELAVPKHEELIAILNQHAKGSASVGLNLFPLNFKQKTQLDLKGPQSQILFRSN